MTNRWEDSLPVIQGAQRLRRAMRLTGKQVFGDLATLANAEWQKLNVAK